jgi:hypothetical protein
VRGGLTVQTKAGTWEISQVCPVCKAPAVEMLLTDPGRSGVVLRAECRICRTTLSPKFTPPDFSDITEDRIKAWTPVVSRYRQLHEGPVDITEALQERLDASTPTPMLGNISGMLRKLADEIDATAPGYRPDVCLIVLSSPGEGCPDVRAYGRALRQSEADGLLLQAAMQQFRR